MHVSTTELLGVTAGQARRAADASVISAIEQTASGETHITFGQVTILPSGNLGRVNERGVVRLSPAEREELIRKLTDHRFHDLTTGQTQG